MFKPDENAERFGSLSIENLFFTDYLPMAGGDAVRVYLFALYRSAHPKDDYSLTEMAKELSLPESEVESALRYWERRRLLTRISDSPLQYVCHSPLETALTGRGTLQVDSDYVAFSEDVYALFGDRRKIKPSEIALAYDWTQDFSIPSATVLMYLSDCIARRGILFSFKSAQTDLARMVGDGVKSVEDAEEYFRHSRQVEDGARAVLRRFGRRTVPSRDEMDLYRKWLDEWHFTPDAIQEACTETTKGEPSFAYLDGILKGLMTRAAQKNTPVRTGEEVRAELKGDEQLKEFARALGMRSSAALSATWRRLCENNDAALVLFAASEAHRTGGNLETCERYLETYRRLGLATRPEAEQYMQAARADNAVLYRLFEACGHTGKPTAPDRELLHRWQDWGFTEEMLLLAATESRGAETKVPYINKVLESWHNDGILTPAEVASRRSARPRPAAAGNGVKQVSAQQYTQREYTESELSDLDFDIFEEARKQHG